MMLAPSTCRERNFSDPGHDIVVRWLNSPGSFPYPMDPMMVFGSYDGLPLPCGSYYDSLPLPYRSYDGLPLYLMDGLPYPMDPVMVFPYPMIVFP